MTTSMPDTREKCPECDGRGTDSWGSTCLLCGGQGRAPFREWGKENDEDDVSDMTKDRT